MSRVRIPSLAPSFFVATDLVFSPFPSSPTGASELSHRRIPAPILSDSAASGNTAHVLGQAYSSEQRVTTLSSRSAASLGRVEGRQRRNPPPLVGIAATETTNQHL